MTTFGLVALGILIGLLFAIAAAAIAVMAYSSYRQRQEMADVTRRIMGMMRANSAAMLDMNRDVTAALAAMDANRLHDASIAIQQGAKKLDHAVTSLNKVIFAAGMSDNMNLDAATLDEMQDVAQPQRVIQYDQPQPFSARVGYPPTGSFPAAQNQTDPFYKWRQDQQERAAQESGQSFAAAPAGPLPDLDAAYLEDLADSDVMSDAGMGAIPGMTPGALEE